MLIWPANRFVAGEDEESAIDVVRELNAHGISASLDMALQATRLPGPLRARKRVTTT